MGAPPALFPDEDENVSEEEPIPAMQAVLQLAEDIARRIIERLALLNEVGREELLRAAAAWGAYGRPHDPSTPGVAIDSSYPVDGGIDLVLARLAVVVAGFVCFNGAETGEKCPSTYAREVLAEGHEDSSKLMLIAKSLEKRLAIRLLRSRGGSGFRMMLLDGEVVPYQLLLRPSAAGRSRLLQRLDRQSCTMLREARNKGVTIVGVVKRSYTRLFAALLKEERGLVNDRALATLMLKRGEYVVLGGFDRLLPLYARYIAEKRGGNADGYAESVRGRLTRCPEYGGITVAFYKPRLPRAAAVKVEIFNPDPLGGVEQVIALLDNLTNPATGLPYPVDLVDRMTWLNSANLELLRRRILGLLSREPRGLRYAKQLLSLLEHGNPEKVFLYQPP